MGEVVDSGGRESLHGGGVFQRTNKETMEVTEWIRRLRRHGGVRWTTC